MDGVLNDLMDGAARDQRHKALEAENERLRDTVKELKVKGGEHVCELFARVQTIKDSMSEPNNRLS